VTLSAAVWSAGALGGYRVRATNLSRYSANKIHDDAVARSYGYAGGLVAGTTVYAYLTRPLVAAWGLAWLERGTARLTLLRPVYDGEALGVDARLVGRSGSELAGEVTAEVTATTAEGGPAVAALVAGHAWGTAPALPDVAAYPAAPVPAVRPAAAAVFLRAEPLGSPVLLLDEATATDYAREVDDSLAVYHHGREAVAHPGLLLQQANRALSENVVLGPWIHAASDVAHCGLARVGDRLSTRGRPVRAFERKGQRCVELDLLVVANDVRPVLHVRHTAIYEPRAAAAGATEAPPRGVAE
jgi:acyl dehydratase